MNCLQLLNELRDVWLPARAEPRRRRQMADRLRTEGVDCRETGKDRRAREESGELRPEKRDGDGASFLLRAFRLRPYYSTYCPA
jgi:hypothetical protein